MSTTVSLYEQIDQDIWKWINEFVTVPNEFYDMKFAPCPYARAAVAQGKVDVRVWESVDVRKFIREGAVDMREAPHLTTRVMTFPPKTRFLWGINDYVEELNMELVPTNVFLNTGIALNVSALMLPNGVAPVSNSIFSIPASAATSRSPLSFTHTIPAPDERISILPSTLMSLGL